MNSLNGHSTSWLPSTTRKEGASAYLCERKLLGRSSKEEGGANRAKVLAAKVKWEMMMMATVEYYSS